MYYNIIQGTTSGLDGVDIRLLNLLADKLNFSYNNTIGLTFENVQSLVWFCHKHIVSCLLILHIFQANKREIDIALVRDYYSLLISPQNDFLGTVGCYDIYTLSTPPEKYINYATVVKPYGIFIWALIGTSLVVVILTFLIIEKLSDTMHGLILIPTHQS